MSLVEELEKKLNGGKFRLLNEKVYKSKELTKEEARKYHLYYTEQMKKWPQHPKKMIVEKIELAGDANNKRIADSGCGDAELSRIFTNVVSYDKYPMNKNVKKAELENIPAPDNEFDILVNSLSLMTNYISKVVKEANRVLKMNGRWYIGEISSRIVSNRKLIDSFAKFGFKLLECDTRNKYFCIFVFEKISEYSNEGKLPEIRLKPCLYKKR